MLTEFHIGIDDTDSKFGGCTTYTAALVFEKLLEHNVTPTDFPWLVRLNPNIPWKTRGNGALAIHVRVNPERTDEVKRIVIDLVRKTSDPSIPGTDPAAVFLEGPVPKELTAFCGNALHDVISIEEAEALLQNLGVEAHTMNGPRGIIGALASLGYGPGMDYTYEIIGYRTREYLGKTRRVDLDSVRCMDEDPDLHTFNNVDPETRRVLTCPHGPDPVLIGIRGEDPAGLISAFSQVKIEEPVERVMIFKTNQGTDTHLTRHSEIAKLAAHKSVVVKGRVSSRPMVLRGGHVIFSMDDSSGSVDCAAYEPTGSFRRTILQLLPGDSVKALGGVRAGPGSRLTVNLEKLEVLELAEHVQYFRPRCAVCGSSCETMGRGQGFRCRKCGRRFPRTQLKRVPQPRQLTTGMYFPPPRAHRHLTKPRMRRDSLVDQERHEYQDGGSRLGARDYEFYLSQLPIIARMATSRESLLVVT